MKVLAPYLAFSDTQPWHWGPHYSLMRVFTPGLGFLPDLCWQEWGWPQFFLWYLSGIQCSVSKSLLSSVFLGCFFHGPFPSGNRLSLGLYLSTSLAFPGFLLQVQIHEAKWKSRKDKSHRCVIPWVSFFPSTFHNLLVFASGILVVLSRRNGEKYI